MTTTRWERERAALLMERSRPGTASRRRAELLGRQARRLERSVAGVESAPVQDEITPGFLRRRTGGEDSRFGGTVLLGLVGTAAAVAVGAGVAAGYGGYRALEQVAAPRLGRLWAWPWLAASGLLALVLVLTGTPFGLALHLDRHFPVSLLQLGPWWGWMLWQLAVALAAVAYWVHAWGWAGVPAGAVGPPAKNRDGSWRETPDSELVRLAEEGATVVAAPTTKPKLQRRGRPGVMGAVLDGVELLGEHMISAWSWAAGLGRRGRQ